MKHIILRPTAKDSWSGIIKYKNCYEDIAPYYTRSGRIYTGLTESDEIRLGKILGIDLTTGSEYWKNFYVRTSGKDLYLDIEDPLDELKYLFLKNHKRVAASLTQPKATANFVLINQEAEAKESNNLARIRRKALRELDKLSINDMRQALRLFGHNAESMDAEVVENRLTEIVESNPDKFLSKWVDNTTKDTEYILSTAVAKGVLRKNKTTYKYGTDVLGYTLEDAIDYLDKPENQDIKLTLMKAIESK